MKPFELVGPSYTSQSPNLADQLTMGWYPESSEGEGQSPAALYPTPGTRVFCATNFSPIRGSITADDRTFVVAGSHFLEIFADGTFFDYGTVLNDSLPVSMAAGSSQILVASAGMVYVFDFSTGHIGGTALNQGGNNGVFTSVLNAPGTGYVAGDTFTVDAGNMDATGIVDTTGGGGAVTAYHITSVGTNYALNVGTLTSPSGVQPAAGTGLTIDVTGLGGGYAAGDTGTIQGGTTQATYIVNSVDANGNVLTYTISNGGAGYVVQNNVMTATGGAQPGIGAGFTININTVVTTNSFGPLPNGTLLGPVSFVAYIEGFFVALLSNSNQFQWSAPLDASIWDPLDTNKVSVFAGNVLSMFADHNELWFWGERQSVAYSLTGSVNTFDVIQGSFMEAGIFAPNSPVRLDNSIFWLGGDERGAGVVWRANGYTPNRVSNHAIEFALQGYLSTYGAIGLSNVVGYSYQDQGHGFYVLFFPTPSATWVYDVATGMWHQRGFWNSGTNMFTAHRSQNHTFNFGKHLVGDWASGNVNEMNINIFTDSDPAQQSATLVLINVIFLFKSGISYDVGSPSVNGRTYNFSITVQNNGPHPIDIVYGLVPSLVSVSVASGAIYTLPAAAIVGDGVNDLLLGFQTGAVSQLLDVIALDPIIFDTVAATNLIPLVNRQFQGWNSTEGGGEIWLQGQLDPGATGNMIRRVRRTRHASSDQSYVFHKTLQIYAETGVGPQPPLLDGMGQPRDPMINLRWSNNGGFNWSNELSAGLGQAGNYGQRVMFRRLGRARARVYEVSGSDPVPYRLVGAYLDVSAGEGA